MATGKTDHSEETKIKVRKSDVSISNDGHLTIKDPKLVEKLTANKIRDAKELASDEVSVGVVVSKSF
jgi:hypothetical protein